MPYTDRAIEMILKEAEKLGEKGMYIDMTEDEIVDLGDFCFNEVLDIYWPADDGEGACVECGNIPGCENLKSNEPYLNHCYSCIEKEEKEEEKIKYFKSLKQKGLLEEYGDWISKLYPEYKKYMKG